MARRQLAQEDYADAGRGRTRGSTLHTYHEPRAHSVHGRKARTLVDAGAWAVPTAGRWIEYIKENKRTLWLVGGKHCARAAGLGFGIEIPARHSRP